MRRLLPLLLLPLVSLLVAADPPKKKGTSYAFLVGCAGYNKTELKPIPGEETVNDVVEFKKALLATGFEDDHIVMLHDRQADVKGGGQGAKFLPECEKIKKQLDLLLSEPTKDDTVVVVLSGHGVHFKGEKSGYFCPLDAKVSTKQNLLPLDGPGGVYTLLEKCKAGRKLLVANACRFDPVAPGVDLAGGKVELADEYPEAVPEGIAALYSCEVGQKSYFDPDRKRSLFMLHLTDAWTGGANLEEVFDATGRKTKADARKTYEAKQTPVVKRNYTGEWLLAGATAAVPVPAKPKVGTETVEEFEWQKEKRKRTVRVIDVGGEPVEFVKVPAGKFTMGSAYSDDIDVRNWECPQHKVTFTKDLWVAKYPTTKKQFAAFVTAAGYTTEAESDSEGGIGIDGKAMYDKGPKYNWKNPGWKQTDNHPVVNVSWNDALAYCKWAAKEGQAKVRLLSETEYEYMNRGGTTTRYHTGEKADSLKGYENVSDQSLKRKGGGSNAQEFDDEEPFTSEVGKYMPNGFGLYDTTGNVRAWCADWFDDQLCKRGDVTDPPSTTTGQKLYAAVRGASWTGEPGFCRPACRVGHSPTHRDHHTGFRVCFTPE